MADITGGLKQLRENLSKMTFKEKLEHLWSYYRSTLLITIILIVAVSILITCLINVNTRTIISGVSVNVHLTEEGLTFLGEDYYNRVHEGSGLEKAYITEITLYDLSEVDHYEETYYSLMSLAALISEEELDYMICDRVALTNFIRYQNILLDLRELFTQEELDALGTRVIHQQAAEDGINVPVGIDITDIPFIQSNSLLAVDSDDPVYICFARNTPREELCRDIYEYILAWEAE